MAYYLVSMREIDGNSSRDLGGKLRETLGFHWWWITMKDGFERKIRGNLEMEAFRCSLEF